MSEKLILELRFVTGGRAKSLIPGHFLGGLASHLWPEEETDAQKIRLSKTKVTCIMEACGKEH